MFMGSPGLTATAVSLWGEPTWSQLVSTLRARVGGREHSAPKDADDAEAIADGASRNGPWPAEGGAPASAGGASWASARALPTISEARIRGRIAYFPVLRTCEPTYYHRGNGHVNAGQPGVGQPTAR